MSTNKLTTVPQIFAWALRNNLHLATDSEAQAWAGAEGTLYLAEDLTTTVVIDVCVGGIDIEVHNWDDGMDAMGGYPDCAFTMPANALPL